MFAFQSGDILFQDTECGAVCDAIRGVTEGFRGAEINHCGVYAEADGVAYVLEAITPRVVARKAAEFLGRTVDHRGRPRVMVGRINPEHHSLRPAALAWMWAQIGRPYDIAYLPDDRALYCSELVVKGFRHANGGQPFLPEVPMSFRDPVTDEILGSWVVYFERLGMDVPDGVIGSNPATLSLSEKLHVMAQLGDLTGAPLGT